MTDTFIQPSQQFSENTDRQYTSHCRTWLPQHRWMVRVKPLDEIHATVYNLLCRVRHKLNKTIMHCWRSSAAWL